ncbi:MAG: TSUP family transporter [Verrucomicrobia bacterium]|nr:TSUP family transporter [Verrucomicrobiota bacterium]
MEWWWYPALFMTGLVAGFVDAVAGGGGLLTVPVLLATGMTPQDVLGTNKFQSSCGTSLATWQYARHGLLHWEELRLGVGATLVGALAGAWAVTRISPEFLRPVIPFLLLAIAVYTACKHDLGQESRTARWPAPVFGLVFGLGLGFYDGFFGPGTGSFWTVAGVLILGLNLLRATAYTKAMNLTSNLASLAVFLVTGHVRFGVGLTMAAGQMIGGQLGARMAVKGGAKVIRPVFLTMVIALTLKLAWDAFRR